MTHPDRMQVLGELTCAAMLPAFHAADVERTDTLGAAAAAAGARAVEITLSDEPSRRVFADLVARTKAAHPALMLGAGGLVDTAAALAALDAGAAFVRGAGFNEDIARLCNRRRVAYLPTCGSPASIGRAEEMGTEIIGVPVGGAGGLEAVQAVRRASPASRLMVSDDQPLSEARVRQWIDAGASLLVVGPGTLTTDLLAGPADGVRAKIADVRRWIRRASGGKLFQGVEHVGLYEHQGSSAAAITNWYRDTFSWDVEEGKAYYFAAGDGPGRIEVMKVGKTDRCHLAIKVADLEEASAVLKEKGIDLVPPETRPDGRNIFFTVTDPAGNILHLLP